MSRWTRFRQWLYPREFRIPPIGDEQGWSQMVAHALAALEQAAEAKAQTEVAAPVQEQQPSSPSATGPDKAFVIDLCNQVHRISRSVKKMETVGGAESERLKGHLDRLRRVLDEHSVTWEDLTGQAFDPGRFDFEPLGEPQVTSGLLRETIIQCERPAIKLSGKMIQKARGVIGKPAG